MIANNGDKTPRAPRKDTITELLNLIEDKFGSEGGKATVADYVRLTQLEREFAEQEKVQPRKIKVTWIEPSEMFDTEE